VPGKVRDAGIKSPLEMTYTKDIFEAYNTHISLGFISLKKIVTTKIHHLKNRFSFNKFVICEPEIE
jgi:hypothetical protein